MHTQYIYIFYHGKHFIVVCVKKKFTRNSYWMSDISYYFHQLNQSNITAYIIKNMKTVPIYPFIRVWRSWFFPLISYWTSCYYLSIQFIFNTSLKYFNNASIHHYCFSGLPSSDTLHVCLLFSTLQNIYIVLSSNK